MEFQGGKVLIHRISRIDSSSGEVLLRDLLIVTSETSCTEALKMDNNEIQLLTNKKVAEAKLDAAERRQAITAINGLTRK